MLSVINAECRKLALYTECLYAECCYAQCHHAECCYAEGHHAECRGAQARSNFSSIEFSLQ
jgi:hypothetical protein